MKQIGHDKSHGREPNAGAKHDPEWAQHRANITQFNVSPRQIGGKAPLLQAMHDIVDGNAGARRIHEGSDVDGKNANYTSYLAP
jgi:hypothetical protein